MYVYVRVSTIMVYTNIFVKFVLVGLQKINIICLSWNSNKWQMYWLFLIQDAKGNFVRRWIQRQLNFGKKSFCSKSCEHCF